MSYPKDERLRGRGLQERNRRILSKEPLCRICKSKNLVAAAEEIDHVIPLHKGGLDHESNLQPLCRKCHDEKTITERGQTLKAREPLGLDW